MSRDQSTEPAGRWPGRLPLAWPARGRTLPAAGLRLAAKALGISQVRLVLEVQEDGDIITMSTGQTARTAPLVRLEVATGPVLARVEYRRGQGELDAAGCRLPEAGR